MYAIRIKLVLVTAWTAHCVVVLYPLHRPTPGACLTHNAAQWTVTHCTAFHVAGRAFSWSNALHMLYCCHRTKSFWSTSALCGLSSAARCWQTYVRMCIVVVLLIYVLIWHSSASCGIHSNTSTERSYGVPFMAALSDLCMTM